MATETSTQCLCVRLDVWTGGQRINPAILLDFGWMTMWNDGSNTTRPMGSYTPWATGQPDNWLNFESCLVLYAAYGFAWIDGPCSSIGSFLCEVELI